MSSNEYTDAIKYIIQHAIMDMRKEIKEQLTPLIEDIAELKTRQYLLEQDSKSLAQLYDELEKMEEGDERKL